MNASRSAHYNFVRVHGVPDGWTEVRLRDVAKFVGGGTPDSAEPEYWNGDIPWLSPTEMTGLKSRFAFTSERRLTQKGLDACNCCLLQPGSIVMTTRGTVGLVVIAGVPLTCNQSCEALIPSEDIQSEFLYYLLVYIRPLIERFGAGTTFSSVTRRDVRDIRFALPSKDEREKIVKQLVASDEAIAAAEERLTAARRVKTALMQQLFTRGLPGRHTRFQQTKIGDIPVEWELKTLTAHCGGSECVKTGPFGAQLPPEAFALSGVRMANITDIGEGELMFTSDFYVTLEVFNRLKDYALTEGDVVFSRVASVGRLALIRKEHEPLLMSSNCIRLRPGKAFNAKFLTHIFHDAESVARQVLAMSNAGARPIVTPRFLRRMLVPRPSLEEQDEIANLIEVADANEQAVKTEIVALDRLRRALLQNLLTGRVRVNV